MTKTLHHYTAADAMLQALQDGGVSYLFANFGSDHPSIIEGLSKAKAEGRALPNVVMCPHEHVALCAAHGYAQVTGQAQGVIVHCDVGTQNLGGAVHNAARARVPVFIFAGETPYTIEERRGMRKSPANFLQDTYDQHGIVRPYVKWSYSIRTGSNIKQLTNRALQMAHSEPKGPVYLTGAREVLEEEGESAESTGNKWSDLQPSALPASGVEEITCALLEAKQPLVITSYLGRNPAAVQELVRFCELLAIPVIEHYSSYMNFPATHPFHLGYSVEGYVDQADVIVVLDSDVPWIPSIKKPKKECRIYYIDVDPLKEGLPLWGFPSERYYKADTEEGLRQLNNYLSSLPINSQPIQDRAARLFGVHTRQREEWRLNEQRSEGQEITPEWLTACLRELIDDETIILNETITNAKVVGQHLPRNIPGSFYGSGGTSLGWNGGAAIGVKLASPDKNVIVLTGDGSYFFSIPSSVHWVARKYKAPFMTVIYNNQGWKATKHNVDRLYPDGKASMLDSYWVHFDQPADLAKIAEAAGGAFAETVTEPSQLKDALRRGLDAVQDGRSSVIDVHLPAISKQRD
ncbi:thiamine pyrophosphate-requiring protein [Brevibacillus sp. NRS-1366]|uniref:thiamine pyrophosphate-requiring protein n=1 Tax=Brevibacillus sp. NRS-1366 TaxID=3233899 RepID=UPI003D19D1A1